MSNNDPLPNMNIYDNLRNRAAIKVANVVLRLTDVEYRVGIKNAMRLGFATATERHNKS